jgi:hypothetical protein
MPRELERHLVVASIPAQTLAPVLAGEHPGQFPLARSLADYGEWDIVSHSFEVREDGTAILTAIFETKVRRSGSRRQEGSSETQREERRQQRKEERQRRKEERRQQRQRG